MKAFLSFQSDDVFLIVGLGNRKSTPDSLGPSTIDNILVTRYLYLLGDIHDGYRNVCSFVPDVMGNTGIETSQIIQSIIRDTKATKVIVIDSLKTDHMDRLIKTIQITDQGIFPGSGIGNNRKEISKETVGVDVIAIGVPTVVDLRCFMEISKNHDALAYIVTPTNIDFVVEKLGILIGNGINISLHEDFMRQNNSFL